jgi:guanine deaminase
MSAPVFTSSHNSGMTITRAYRANVLWFDSQSQAQWISDGLLVCQAGKIVALGDADKLLPGLSNVVVQSFPGCVIAPGFVDTHIHYPQLDVIGSPATGLLPWLENYTFPRESQFDDAALAQEVAVTFLDELQKNGVSTASVYCTAHALSVDTFFTEAQRRGLRMIAGKSMQDRNSPAALTDNTAAGLKAQADLIDRWHGKGRLGYAITPRFAPSCTDTSMAAMGELAAAKPDVWLQTHVAENHDEIAWVQQLYPKARSYLDVYDGFGMLRPRSIYAHCIWLDETDRKRMAQAGASIAVCPTSNLFLGSGLFDFDATNQAAVAWSLASDIGGGTSFSPFATMLAAYQIARLQGQALSAQQLWWHHTVGGAAALGLQNHVGNLQVGLEADAVILDPSRISLLSRRLLQANTLEEWLFAMMVLADDRVVRSMIIGGEVQRFEPLQ